MSAIFPITYQITAEDNASSAIQSIVQVMRQGASASQEAKNQFTALRTSTRLQTSAMNELRAAWRVNHEELVAFGQTMQSVGAIGNQLLSIINSLILSQIQYALIQQNLSGATANAAVLQQEYQQAVATWGPTSQQAISLQQQWIQATNQAATANKQASIQTQLLNAQWIGIGLSIPGIIASIVTVGSRLPTLFAAFGEGGSVLAGLGSAGVAAAAGVIAVAGGIALGAYNVGRFMVAGESWKQSLDDALSSLNSWPDGLKQVGQAFTYLGAGMIRNLDVGKIVLTGLGELVTNAGAQAEAGLGNVRTQLGHVWENMTASTVTTTNTISTVIRGGWGLVSSNAQNVWGTLTGAYSTFGGGMQSASSTWMSSVKSTLAQGWQNISSTLSGIWSQLIGTLKTMFGPIVSFLSGVWDSILSTASSIWATMSGALMSVWNTLVGIGKTIWGALTSFFSGLWNDILTVGNTIWNTIRTGLQTLWNGLVNAARTIWGALTGFFSSLWSGIQGVATAIWNGIVAALQSLWGGAVATGTTIWNALVGFFSSLWGGIQTATSGAWSAISSALQAAWNGAVSSGQTIWNALTGFFSTLWSGIQGTTTGIWNSLVAAVDQIWNGFWSGLNSIWQSIGQPIWSAIQTALGTVYGAFQTFWSDVQSGWNALWNGLGGVISSVVGTVEGAVRGILNGVISLVNTFVNGIDSIIVGINSVASTLQLPGLPTIPDIPMLKGGGITKGPGLFMAGEAGPELIAGASVIPLPNTSSGGIGSGTTINVYVTVEGSMWSFNELVQELDRKIYDQLARQFAR